MSCIFLVFFKSCYLFFPVGVFFLVHLCVYSLLPLPPVASSLCVSFFFNVKHYSDFPALTLICVLADSVSGSPLHLTCRVSDPCLCLTLISACSLNKSLFHSHFPVHLGPSAHFPFTVRNRFLLTMFESLGQSNQYKAEDLKWYFVFALHKVIIYLIFNFQPRQKDRSLRQPSA